MVRGVRPAPIDGKPPPAKGSPPTTPTKELSDAAQYEKSSRCPLNLENSLALLVALLSILSLAAQLSCDHLLRQGVDLGSSDEQRIALRIADIEADITRSFDARQIDASADDAQGQAPTTTTTVDPTTPNADGEFEVPTAQELIGHERLLASKLLVPVAADSWCELRLASTVPAGAYSLELGGIIGRLGAHGSGGCLLLQVHFNGAWQPLLGSPRRRTEQLEAPLEHRFAVPHPFDGVRFLAATYGSSGEAGGRIALTHLAKQLSPPKPPPQKRSRFLVFELDRGFGASQLGLFNGIALAYLLNVTAVLPRFHTYHDEHGHPRPDPSAAEAYVPMDFFFDTTHFMASLASTVRTVKQLPPALNEFARDETIARLDFVNPAMGADRASLDLGRLSRHFKMHNVLLVGSTARRIVWNTPQLAALRLKLHAALKPSAHVEAITTHVQEAMAAFAYRKGLSPAYVGLQLPLGQGWREYCRQEMLATTMGDSGAGGAGAAADEGQQGCDMSAEAVTQVLEERQVGELSRVLYVASGVLNITQVHQLHKQRFVVMSKARFTLDIHPDLAHAVEYQLCKRASLFVGNLYSSFSFLLREAHLASGEAERAMYYNLDADATLGDLTREEALRWDVLPLGGVARHSIGAHAAPEARGLHVEL